MSDNHNQIQNNDKPWLWKKGQSGNPLGRPKGKTAKERAKEYLLTMSDDEFEAFLIGMNKKDVWEMAEGRPAQDVTSGGKPLQTLLVKFIDDKDDNGDTKGVQTPV